MTYYTATYSPDDNKLRLYAGGRLDKETYEKARALGFRWAPKQELFVAPMWTPQREDFLLELADEIEDEDKSLVERAEERAERFEEYSDHRRADGEAALKAVDAIAKNIPFGQPILVGHHSEKHARRDKKRIDDGMRRAIKMWDTSKYWTSRAAGALRAAKYKELPAVRHRRIKTLTAEKRKQEKTKQECEMWLHLWTECGNETDTELQKGVALRLANMCWLHLPRKEGDREDWPHRPTAYDALTGASPTLYAPRSIDEIVEHAKETYPKTIAWCDRWIAHYENRLAYEKAMLDEQIGTGELGGGMGGRFDIKPGGKVLTRDGWLIVIRVNKADGAINSVTTQAPAGVTWQKFWKYEIERVKDYQPPTEEMAAKIKKATKLPPICNYRVEGCVEMTDAEWKQLMKRKWSDFPYYAVVKATETAGRHRIRQRPASHLRAERVFITDSKRVDPPKPEPRDPLPPPQERERFPAGASTGFPKTASQDNSSAPFEAMRDSLKAGGVKVVTAPQLFPTPQPVAERAAMVADLAVGQKVLEPSAGTGALLDVVRRSVVEGDLEVTAVEINHQLAEGLRTRWPGVKVVCDDFLACNGDLGQFDRVVMNPPFERGADIKHVEHAFTMLRPGGRLVAIVAGGPRQHEKFFERASVWEELPSGTFEGTGVRSVLMAIDKEA